MPLRDSQVAHRSRDSQTMAARIYRPAKNAMQAGTANTDEWLLEFETDAPRKIEPLMGYTTSADTRTQVRLYFPSAEAAENYCRKNGITYRVQKPHEPRRQRATYAENFSYSRKTPWTH
jgi:hypothetical protein